MLGRIMAGVARTGIGIGVGVAIDPAANLTRRESDARAGSGSAKCRGLASSRAADRKPATRRCRSPDCATSWIECPAGRSCRGASQQAQRVDRQSLRNVADPRAAVGRLESGVGNIKDDVNTVRGATAIVSGSASLTKPRPQPCRCRCNGYEYRYFRGYQGCRERTFAAATTTKIGVQDVADALTAACNHDIQQAAVGVAISSTVAAAVGATPHPAAKVASVVISATGKDKQLVPSVGGLPAA